MFKKPVESSPTKIEVEGVLLFGRFLTTLRKALSKTYKQIFSELGLSKMTILKWESGENFPAKDKLPAIAAAYGADLEELIKVFEISKQAREKEKSGRSRIDLNPRNR